MRTKDQQRTRVETEIGIGMGARAIGGARPLRVRSVARVRQMCGGKLRGLGEPDAKRIGSPIRVARLRMKVRGRLLPFLGRES